jgi:type VI secretion system secreted protein VgrG
MMIGTLTDIAINKAKDKLSSMSLVEKFSLSLPSVPLASLTSMLAAFADAFTQGNRLFTLQIGDGQSFGERLLPQSVEATESLSACYKYEVTCLSPDAFIPLESLLGQSAQLDIITGSASPLDFDVAPEDVTRCGLITAAEALPSDGGFAKYLLTIEPPLALLRYRITSRVFQDLTVPEIVEQILKEHIDTNSAIGKNLALRRDLIQRHLYQPRSYCLQYRESDLAFIERILFEEGIAYRFEHEGGEAPTVTFIQFDDPYGLPESKQKSVRFHRPDATESEDSLSVWTENRRIGSGRATLRSYEYKQVLSTESGEESQIDQGEEGSAAESSLEDFEAQTHYYGKDSNDLSRYGERRQEAHDGLKRSYTGQGNLRQLQAGQWFELIGHPVHDKSGAQQERQFVACILSFSASNNLPVGLLKYLQPQSSSEPPPYWVNLEARRYGQPLTPGYGHTRHAKPTAPGIQTATVTGPTNEEVYTDAMGRIRIQFHWQRQKEHPEYGANLDDNSSCWVRVAHQSAGSAWGHQFIPRVGQEVVVDFVEGDIDRPLITNVVYNGRHPTPWFGGKGELPENKTLSGIKSKEHYGTGYNELLFDDTPDQLRAVLSSEHGKTQLNQGYLIEPREKGTGTPRGDGFELRTDRHGAIRAAEGLLLSTESCPGASGGQLAREQALTQLQMARTLAQSLSDTAEKQDSHATEIGPEQRDEDGQKQAKTLDGHLDHYVQSAQAWESGTNTDPEHKTATTEQAGRQGILLASGAEGIGLSTQKELILTSGANLDAISMRDMQQSTARRWLHNVGKRISLFVAGVAGKVSLRLIAGKGDAQLHAQSGDVEVIGEQNLRLTANKRKLTATAGEEMLLTCAGAYIRLKGGKIDIHCPGTLSIKSDDQDFGGPASMDVKHPAVAQGRIEEEELLKMINFSG